jgi:hypothetical protein
MSDIHEGGCACGSVRYRVTGEPNLTGVCHCTFCKRRTGSAFGMSAYFDQAAVQISGVLKIYESRSDESNRLGKMEFCPNCGTTVTWTAELFPGARAISVGTFDEPNWIKFSAHVFTRSALHWMVFPADVAVFETLPEIDLDSFVSSSFPPHVHGENCPECAALADLTHLSICCGERDLHVLAHASDRLVLVPCLNSKCNGRAIVPKRN